MSTSGYQTSYGLGSGLDTIASRLENDSTRASWSDGTPTRRQSSEEAASPDTETGGGVSFDSRRASSATYTAPQSSFGTQSSIPETTVQSRGTARSSGAGEISNLTRTHNSNYSEIYGSQPTQSTAFDDLNSLISNRAETDDVLQSMISDARARRRGQWTDTAEMEGITAGSSFPTANATSATEAPSESVNTRSNAAFRSHAKPTYSMSGTLGVGTSFAPTATPSSPTQPTQLISPNTRAERSHWPDPFDDDPMNPSFSAGRF